MDWLEWTAPAPRHRYAIDFTCKGDIHTRVNLVDPAIATGAAKPLLDEIKGAFGTAQNMFPSSSIRPLP